MCQQLELCAHADYSYPGKAHRAAGRNLLVLFAMLLLLFSGVSPADGRESLVRHSRSLRETASPAVSPAPAGNTTSPSPPPAVNGTSASGNSTGNSTSPSPPSPQPPPETEKGKLVDRWDKAARTPAEKGIAITIGVIMLVGMLTCLVCCVFRRGGQWRIPGLEWFKQKFGKKDNRYSRYMDNNDDGF